MSPPREARHSLGKDSDDSDLLRDLETPARIRTCSSLQGCGSAPYPHPLGGKGLVFSDVQRFEGFPWPNSFIPAVIAMSGKGIFSGSHKKSELCREEAGGIPIPHGGPDATWVSVGCTSHTHTCSFAILFLPEGTRGGRVK